METKLINRKNVNLTNYWY